LLKFSICSSRAGVAVRSHNNMQRTAAVHRARSVRVPYIRPGGAAHSPIPFLLAPRVGFMR
jgi:hypothetical protein